MNDSNKYAKPFDGSEVSDYGTSKINLNHLLKKHEECINILDAIEFFKEKISLRIQAINGFPGTFADLRKKYVNDIDTYKRCISRLYERHERILKQILSY